MRDAASPRPAIDRSPMDKGAPVRRTYRAIHEQAFLPILARDAYPSEALVEACVEAGCGAIEYTLRRPDADRMIPWIRKRFPDLCVLAGSTLDADPVVRRLRRRHPHLRTPAALADLGVHGFVSMFGWRAESIARFAPTHVVIPAAATPTEALRAVEAGAHFVKLLGPELGLVRECRSEAGFGFCPILVTGGVKRRRLRATFEAGAALVGSGCELILSGSEGNGALSAAAPKIRAFVAAARGARRSVRPEAAARLPFGEWLDTLPHVHPFAGGLR